MTRRTAGLAGAAAAIAVVTVVARVAGFGRTLVFARTVGFDCLGSVYQTANTVPNIVFEVVAGGALAALVVPLIAGAVADGDKDQVSRTGSALLTWAVTLLIPAGLLVFVLARPIVSALVGSPPTGCARSDVLAVGTRMLQVFAVQVPLYGIGLVLAGIAQSHRRFLGPALAPLLSSLVVITTYLAYAVHGRPRSLDKLDPTGERLLSVGTTLGVVVLSLSLLVPLRGTGVRLRPRWTFDDGLAARARGLAGAGLATLLAQQVAVAVGLRLANDRGPEGAVALFALASTVFLLPWAVLAVPLATSAFPRAAAAHSAGQPSEWARISAVTARAVVVVCAGSAAVLVAAADPVARLVAQGAPGRADVPVLAGAIALLAPGLLGYGLIAHLGRALTARGDARGAARGAVLGWAAVAVVDVGCVLVAPSRWVVVALALGNSVGLLLGGAALVGRAGDAVRSAVLGVLPRLLPATALACGLGLVTARLWQPRALAVNVVEAVLIGAVVGAAFVALLLALDGPRTRSMLAALRD